MDWPEVFRVLRATYPNIAVNPRGAFMGNRAQFKRLRSLIPRDRYDDMLAVIPDEEKRAILKQRLING